VKELSDGERPQSAPDGRRSGVIAEVALFRVVHLFAYNVSSVRLASREAAVARHAEFDEIGYWSEVKLEILRKYAAAYSKILSAQSRLHHIYIDAFSGAGKHISRATGEFVAGSPLNALSVEPPFREYHFIDLDHEKVERLRAVVGTRPDVTFYEADCNEVLPEAILPTLEWRTFRRALCLLDPYALDLDWRVIAKAGQLRTVDMFLNFPVTDMNRNVLWRAPERASLDQIRRMTRLWGDDTWRNVAYEERQTLFGANLEKRHDANAVLAEAFRQRLRRVAGFGYVPAPMPMRNSHRAVVYYLFFASPKAVAAGIVEDIFKKYADYGE
jgi:three-Cys-motif partner protein